VSTDFKNLIPPPRQDRHWVVHVPRPVPRSHRRMDDAACMAHAKACSWPAGWVPHMAEDVLRRPRKGQDAPWIRVVLVPDGSVPPLGPSRPDELHLPGIGRILAWLDPHRAGAVEDRVHLGGGWYSIGVEMAVEAVLPPGSAEPGRLVVERAGRLVRFRPRPPAEALAWTADLDLKPIPDYRTAGGSVLRVVQDLVPGATRWAGIDGWGPYVEVLVLEGGPGDPDLPGAGPTKPGQRRLLHAGGVAFTCRVEGGVEHSPGHWLKPYRDGGLRAWASAAAASWPEGGTVFGPMPEEAAEARRGAVSRALAALPA
jgi:hypothetical protein